MAGKNIIRADLADAVFRKVGLSRAESADLVEQVRDEISATLATGESVKLSGFGVITVRNKGERIGRNPKTGVAVSIEPCQSITFSASPMLKAHVNGTSSPSSSICSLGRRPRAGRRR
ncbi:integration host factor subunit alpha [Microvirga sp. VF16]|uniref:integration host factor subunit alpha n=1 Tax=Microvirga sp. VF16 TaxID=2807101 RepID=UPI00193D53E0|nr:integration host factor subunit alpha [Microvirga sp. VF16]QRM32717.1 integration host factor subunit alpha [Microvirga sp. VF16]